MPLQSRTHLRNATQVLACSLSLLGFVFVPNLMLPDTTLAHPPVRCNGMIQFRPCMKPVSKKSTGLSRLEITARNSRRASFGENSNSDVEVISPTFKRLTRDLGQWSGRLEGTGEVHLTLIFYRSGRIQARKYMGNVVLKQDRVENISFRFSSNLPEYTRSRDWTWRVIASA